MKPILPILLVSLAATACDTWLTETPRSTLTLDEFYKNEAHAQAAVDAIYAFLRPPYNPTGTHGETPYVMLEVSTGQFFSKVEQSAYTADAARLSVSPESPYVYAWWVSSYQGIEAANLALKHLPGTQMDARVKSQLLGEARFLRALFYFNLVRLFGDVPLKVTATTGPDDGNLAAASVADIYSKVIVPDLLEAETANLPPTSGIGRVSLGTVKSLLAKVYLTMAGYPLQQADTYRHARDKAGEVINSAWFNLFQTDASATWFDKLNNPAYDNREEHILMANYAINIADAYIPMFLVPEEAVDLTPFFEFGGLYPDESFLASYQPDDLRRQNQGFYYQSYTVDGTTYSFPWAIYKFFDKGILETGLQSGKSFPLLRYADVLLVYAEAQNEADGGPNETAYAAINRVRERAGLAPLSGLTHEQFRDAVWKERMWELSAENQTWFDMARTRKAYEAANNWFVDLVGYALPTTGVAFQNKNLRFPIPLREVQTNPNLEQNPGY
jgi:hypothetical protein